MIIRYIITSVSSYVMYILLYQAAVTVEISILVMYLCSFDSFCSLLKQKTKKLNKQQQQHSKCIFNVALMIALSYLIHLFLKLVSFY